MVDIFILVLFFIAIKMFTIYIFADSFKIYEDAIKEYEKRLWKSLKVEKIKPSKLTNPSLIISEETEKIKKIIETNKAFHIILSPNWKNLDTSSFYDLIEKTKNSFSKINFYIWWANWIDYEKLKNICDLELSLSKLTFPHSLALLVLVEQIYRAWMIKKWTDYNK